MLVVFVLHFLHSIHSSFLPPVMDGRAIKLDTLAPRVSPNHVEPHLRRRATSPIRPNTDNITDVLGSREDGVEHNTFRPQEKSTTPWTRLSKSAC
jgi:hypothetical protein